ncbi:MAG: DUF2330 domain-containing protein [Candidatus Saccharicenans sp.]|nr:DUF2330 domain-containing protein [Candidatus Saccharicenans sp.]MDI6850072.1 DUF2330 domain-containing protein [Candidatus Saccharicenans sp.]
MKNGNQGKIEKDSLVMKDKKEKMVRFSVALLYLLLVASFVMGFGAGPASSAADRGSFSPIPANLAQDSQKAIIFHNKLEEILILATELRAEKETEVLEFIPFPSEPAVFLAEGNVLEKVAGLLKSKDVQMKSGFFKGGGGAAAVEIRLSKKIGPHDVTVVKINRPEEFENWVRRFFNQKKMKPESGLKEFVTSAGDYLSRGFNYFVFDSVKVEKETRTVAPLAYRFRSAELYYPLKTSNLVGGRGKVDLILILPGSFWVEEIREDRYFELFESGWEVSSSSRMSKEEVRDLLPETSGFFRPGQKIYLQLLSYFGPYNFKDDLRWDISRLPRYAYKLRFFAHYDNLYYYQKMTRDEFRDYIQSRCQEDPDFLRERRWQLDDQMLGDLLTYQLSCEDFVDTEEFEVYRAVFNPPELSTVRLDGLPVGFVLLEDKTRNRMFEKLKGVEKALLDDYNSKNKKQYRLSENLPEGLEEVLAVRESGEAGPGEGQSLLSSGRTYVSRVGFNPGRTTALVFVSHVAGPEMGVGYLVLLEKHRGAWLPTGILRSEIY